MLKHKPLFLIAAIITVISALSYSYFTSATNYCTSEKCLQAAAEEAEARNRASEAAANVLTLEEEIARLEAEIIALQAEIVANQATADDIAERIKFTEAKLTRQQSALASLLVEMHFETDADAIMILAGSSSISDLAEKQSRKDTVKNQVNLASQEIKNTKLELEKQKSQIDAIIENQKIQEAEIANTQARQAELRDKYQNDAANFSADAEEARRIKEEEIRAQIASMNSNVGGGVIVDPGLDSYASSLASATGLSCPSNNWRYDGIRGYTLFRGGYVCECTSYAGFKANEYWGVTISSWGDAKNWGYSARARGYTVDASPAPHTVAFYTSGTWGHVVWVESVNPNGTIDYSEYNGRNTANFSYVTNANPSLFNYIHFNY